MRSRSPIYDRAYAAALAVRNSSPTARKAVHLVNRALRLRPPVSFAGWGMSTEHALPWADGDRWASFRLAIEDLHAFEFTGEAGSDNTTLDNLRWRHWTIAFAVEHALSVLPRVGTVHGVECGVADGMTAYVAGRQLDASRAAGGPSWDMHLYDSWGTMLGETLLDTEQQQAGRYANLSLELTRRNLWRLAEHYELHVGYLPDSFEEAPPPDEILFVHVDLNAALPTKAVCEVLWPRLVAGGVFIFDDYGWKGFEDTKRIVDEFFADKPGVLFTSPTGQGIFFRAAA